MGGLVERAGSGRVYCWKISVGGDGGGLLVRVCGYNIWSTLYTKILLKPLPNAICICLPNCINIDENVI